MSDTVIVVGAKRGRENVSAIEVKQMVGRAGRKHGGGTAVAHVILEEDCVDDIRAGLDDGANMEVHSVLGDIDSLIFHIMPEIISGSIYDVSSAQKWLERSLLFVQEKKVNWEKVFERMEKTGAIHPRNDDSRISATKIGIIATEFYFHPSDVNAWCDNFSKIFEMGVENDTASIAWALGTRPYGKSLGDFGDSRYIIEECKSAIPMGLAVEKGMVTQVVLWWCMMGGPPAGKMRNQMLALREDIGRIKRVLLKLNKDVAGWNMGSFFDDVELMARKCIRSDLLELCRLPGITKGRAEFLYNLGVKDAYGIADMIGNISGEIDKQFEEVLKGISDGVKKQSN